jgi:hypothetical protein
MAAREMGWVRAARDGAGACFTRLSAPLQVGPHGRAEAGAGGALGVRRGHRGVGAKESRTVVKQVVDAYTIPL